jgi:hypothetical protein
MYPKTLTNNKMQISTNQIHNANNQPIQNQYKILYKPIQFLYRHINLIIYS